jgi:GMP synthase (glutamine-hydrolysing)
MAKALGAAVRPGLRKEIGWAPIDLTDAGRTSVLAALANVPVLHWHGDNFDLPVGAARLASTAACPHQAFAVGRHALGLQFHVEAEPERIECWLIGHCGELAQAGIDPRDLRRDTTRFAQGAAAAGRKMISAWLDCMGEDT